MMKTVNLELMLLDWRESARGGAVLVFQVADPDELQPFKLMTLKRGKTAGQRFMAALVEVDEQEQPIAPPESPQRTGKGGPLSILAARLCQSQAFMDWASIVNEGGPAIANEEEAAAFVRVRCGVESRRELDHNADAARIFEHDIRRPYQDWLQKNA